MCTQQHFSALWQVVERLVVDGLQTSLSQSLAFAAIMHNIAQAAERCLLGQFFFGLAYGRCYTEAKS